MEPRVHCAMPTATHSTRKRAASSPAEPRAVAQKTPSATRRRAAASPDDVSSAAPADVKAEADVRPSEPRQLTAPQICATAAAAGAAATSPGPAPAPPLLHVESADTMQPDAEEGLAVEAEGEAGGGHADGYDVGQLWWFFGVSLPPLFLLRCVFGASEREGMQSRIQGCVCA